MTATTIKTLVTLTVLTLATIFPIGDTQTLKMTLLTSAMTLGLGLVLTHIMQYNSLRNNLKLEMPKWSDKIQDKNPLTYIQVIGFLLLTAGTGGLVGGLLQGQTFNFIGTVLLVAGLGTLTGMYLTLTMNKKKKKKTCANKMRYVKRLPLRDD